MSFRLFFTSVALLTQGTTSFSMGMKTISPDTAVGIAPTATHRATTFSRRSFINAGVIGSGVILSRPHAATAAKKDELVSDLKTSVEKLQVIPDLLEKEEWDKVRTILKTPPINNLWNLGDSQNTLVQLAKETGDFELLEIKDELSISLQICDQLTYGNAFVYFQPGNGKVKVKEPQVLAVKAISQINAALEVLK